MYVGIDDDDDRLMAWKKVLESFVTVVVASGRANRIPHNEVTRRAYKDGAEYIVRINDDTRFLTPGWIEQGIAALQSMHPPNIGVVAPKCDEGKTEIFTHDMVHRTHIDIFGWYYPPIFDNWYVDDWITRVYEPNRSVLIPEWRVKHHTSKERYVPDSLKRRGLFAVIYDWLFPSNEKTLSSLDMEIFSGRRFLYDYIADTDTPTKQVISYSLYGNSLKYLNGALENALLAKDVYPGWIVRFYVDDSVPDYVREELSNYDHVEIMKPHFEIKAAMFWRFLVASDPLVERYIIRDVDSRLSQREKAAVDDWIESGKVFHVMRDHPSHSLYPMNAGMWGGSRGGFPNFEEWIGKKAFDPGYMNDMDFLNTVLWPTVKMSVLQHDSFSCLEFGGGRPFPTPRAYPGEHVGSVFIGGKEKPKDVALLLKAEQNAMCKEKKELRSDAITNRKYTHSY